MKKLMGFVAMGLALAFVTNANAAELYLPTPNSGTVLYAAPGLLGDVPPAPAADGEHEHAEAVELFECVNYKDLDEMHPCAKPKIVHVPDPCPAHCCDPCKCCEPRCVAIQICVPPCGCEVVTCNRSGNRIRYSYGDYAVDIRVKKGHIEVDYQD